MKTRTAPNARTNSSRKRERLFVLNNPQAPRLNPELALEIGLNESILLLQLEFLISISTNWRDGRRWTYQSVTQLREMFPFWGRATIQRTIESLRRRKLIVIANYNRAKFDKTRWFSLNPTGIKRLKSVRLAEPGELFQNGTAPAEAAAQVSDTQAEAVPNRNRPFQNGTGPFQDGTTSFHNGTTIPETTSEITPETTEDLSKLRKADPKLTTVDKAVDKSNGNSRPHRDSGAELSWSDEIAFYTEELTRRELNDAGHLQSNVTNAINRWRESGLDVDDFISLMDEAKVRTLKHSASIQTPPDRKARGGRYGQKNRAPYFFAVLKDLLENGGQKSETVTEEGRS